jgi:hypothetical protein
MLIAYASGASNPTQSQVDVIVDLQGGDTLPTTAQVYGGGVDTNNPSASFTFSWSLLRKPSSSAGALNDGALQNPIVGGVDVWGNYLLFLIVTNPATGESSEIDPIAAPSSAFVAVRVKSEQLGLEKPAAGERDWFNKAYVWVDAIEDHEGRVSALETLSQTFALDDLSDVTLGTLTQGDVLKYNGVEWLNSTVDLAGLSDVTLGTLTSGNALVYDGADWVNGDVPSSLTISDEYGAESTTVNLLTEQLVLVSDNGSNVITHGTINGNPKLSIDVAPTLTVDTLNVNGDITVNADGTATDPAIFMLDGSINAPAIIYDTSATTFKIKRTSAEGFKKVITEADRASTSQYGVVTIETNSTGFNSNSKILDVERLMFTGAVDGMVTYKSSTQNHKDNDSNVEILQADNTNIAQRPALIFKNVTGEVIAVSDIALVMASSGISSTQEYAFSFVVYNNLTKLATHVIDAQTALPAFTRVGDNQAGECSFNYVTDNSGSPLEVPPNAFFGVLVTSQPDYAGNRLQCTMQAFRLIS